MSSLSLKNISKTFGPVTAIAGLDLEVKQGELCVLLGPSGCGKSTLLQIIAGLTSQDEGRVLMDNSSIDHLSPRDRNIAMVFQTYALYPHMTVEQNLGFGLRMRGIEKDKINKMVAEAARLLEIEDLLGRKPRQLSGGQRQRVAMGRALVRRPRLFLLDEPLSNLDAQLRVNVRLELKKLHKQIGATMIYVTHDQVEAMTLGDRIVVMNKGKIHQEGNPEDVYERPADKFVATFVGSPVMNFLQGDINRDKSTLKFHSNDFSLNLGNNIDFFDGKNIEIGIRPEDISFEKNKEPGKVMVKVEMISHVGSEKYVHALLGKTNLTIRAPKSANFKPGELIKITIPPSKIHIFENGARIQAPPI
ncbi:ABC transporter ATP-binding protein [Thermodesulfobacteriota bacterium]